MENNWFRSLLEHFEPRYSLPSRKDISQTAITDLFMTSVIAVSCTVMSYELTELFWWCRYLFLYSFAHQIFTLNENVTAVAATCFWNPFKFSAFCFCAVRFISAEWWNLKHNTNKNNDYMKKNEPLKRSLNQHVELCIRIRSELEKFGSLAKMAIWPKRTIPPQNPLRAMVVQNCSFWTIIPSLASLKNCWSPPHIYTHCK